MQYVIEIWCVLGCYAEHYYSLMYIVHKNGFFLL